MQKFVAADVITIERTGENFRLIYDNKGRFAVHRITPEEAKVSCYASTIAVNDVNIMQPTKNLHINDMCLCNQSNCIS